MLAEHLLTGRLPEQARPIQSAIGAVMLVRRAAIDTVGPLDKRIFLYGEDWDWCYRMWTAGWEVHIEPAAVMQHEYERKSRRTFDLRSPAVRHHWASADETDCASIPAWCSGGCPRRRRTPPGGRPGAPTNMARRARANLDAGTAPTGR